MSRTGSSSRSIAQAEELLPHTKQGVVQLSILFHQLQMGVKKHPVPVVLAPTIGVASSFLKQLEGILQVAHVCHVFLAKALLGDSVLRSFPV